MNELYRKYRDKLTKIIQDVSDDILTEEFTSFVRDNWHTDNLKLYRYSQADYFNIRNFETGKLRLSANGILNDIYEGVPIGENKIPNAKQMNLLGKLAYLKCFSESADNTLLWSHYADEHRGFCVEYDLSYLHHNDSILKRIFPVIYTDKRTVIVDIENLCEEIYFLDSDIENNNQYDDIELFECVKSWFIIKDKAWEYENEWRIIYTLSDIYKENTDEIKEHIIAFDCVSSIYLGCRIDKEIQNNIIEIVERLNKSIDRSNIGRNPIKIYKMELSNNSYKLISKEI